MGDATDPTPDAKNPLGGFGGSSAPLNTQEVRLVALALEERWPMSAEARSAAIARLERVVSNPETKPRAFHAALKALTSLSRLNLQVVDVSIRAKASEELEERLQALEERAK